MYLMSFCTPRRSWQSFITAPRYSFGTWMWQVRNGSSMCSIVCTAGSFAGLSTFSSSPLTVKTL